MTEYQELKDAPTDGTRFVGFVRSKFTQKIEPVSVYWCEGLKKPAFVFNGWSDHKLLDLWCPMYAPPNPHPQQ